MAAIEGRKTDRVPVGGLITSITTEMMESTGVYWPDAHIDPQSMGRLAEAAYKDYGLESIKIPFDMVVEAQALGANINLGNRDTFPQVSRAPFEDPRELTIPADYFRRGRFPVVFRAIEDLRSRYDGEVSIVSSIVGPFSLAGILFGIRNFYIWLKRKPQLYSQAMEHSLHIATQYAQKQREAGADIVQIGEALASGDMISGSTYKESVAPYHERLCREMEFPNFLHICGDVTDRVQYIREVPTDGFSFDEKANIKTLVEILKGDLALIGYVPTNLLLNGSPEEVKDYSLECLENGVDILNAGCSLSPHTPSENVKAMVEARDYSSRGT